MRLTTTYKGHEVWVDTMWGPGKLRYGSPALEKEHYESEEQIIAALDRYDLKQRQNFKNKTAYRARGYRHAGRAEGVRVSSISEDGQDAWIVTDDGKREKEYRRNLYANEAALNAMLERKAELESAHEREVDELDRNVARWEPAP